MENTFEWCGIRLTIVDGLRHMSERNSMELRICYWEPLTSHFIQSLKMERKSRFFQTIFDIFETTILSSWKIWNTQMACNTLHVLAFALALIQNIQNGWVKKRCDLFIICMTEEMEILYGCAWNFTWASERERANMSLSASVYENWWRDFWMRIHTALVFFLLLSYTCTRMDIYHHLLS